METTIHFSATEAATPQASLGFLNKVETDDWATPQALFDTLNTEFAFTLDPCSNGKNAKCAKFYTVKEDGLQQDWSGERVFCNPPYGRGMGEWVRKCSGGGGDLGGHAHTGAHGYRMVPRLYI